MQRSAKLRKSLRHDVTGSILPIAAPSILVMAALIGGGFEMSRAYRVQNRLQNACDAGVLAGRRAVSTNGFNSAAQTQADKYFSVNFDPAIQGTVGTTKSFTGDTRGNRIVGSVSTEMPMLLMQIFGIGSMEIDANCISTMGVGNSDVMMVLDVTGSMSGSLGTGTRISALKTAMKNFYITLSTATSGTNARVRYGFVPFSSTVNVGQILYNKDPSYIADSSTIQSRAPTFRNVLTYTRTGWGGSVDSNSSNYDYQNQNQSNRTQLNSTQYNSENSCTSALPVNTTWVNNGSSSNSSNTNTTGSAPNEQRIVTITTTQPQNRTTYSCRQSDNNNKWYVYYRTETRDQLSYAYQTSNGIYTSVTTQVFDGWEYRPVTYDTSVFKTQQSVSTPTGNNGTAVSSSWGGCIEERATVNASAFSFSTMTGMSPSDAFDLDLDMEPDSDPATQWKPLWPQVSYSRNTLAPATTGSSSSSTPYCVRAAQGLETMAQSTFNAYADSLTPVGNTYLDIGMIWGGRLISPEGIFADTVNESPANGGNVSRHVIFMTDGDMNTSNGIYQSYGIEWLDRRITSDGGTTQDDARHSLRFRAVCDAIKAKGVRVWVIAFVTGLNADLSYCATPGSTFSATNAAQLNTSFQEIAKQVGELRVLQ